MIHIVDNLGVLYTMFAIEEPKLIDFGVKKDVVQNEEHTFALTNPYKIECFSKEKREKEDKLGTGQYVERFLAFLKDDTQKRFHNGVIGFVSQFGNGKTFFLQYLYCEVFDSLDKGEEKNYPIYIDISRFEHMKDELFVNILVEVIRQLDLLNNSGKSDAGRVAKSLLKVLPKAIKAVSVGALSALTKQNETVISAISEIGEEFGVQLIGSGNKEAEYLNKLRDALKDDPVASFLIIIDNLDRCRPEFVLELLVILKRLFDVEGMTFILSYDKRQIINLLQTLYGKNVDIQSYIRKYISYEYYMPQYTNNIRQITSTLLEINRGEWEKQLSNGEIVNLKSAIEESDTTNTINCLISERESNDQLSDAEKYSISRAILALMWEDVFLKTTLSLRKYQQGFLHINNFQRTTVNDKNMFLFYIILLYIKLNFPIEYQVIHNYAEDAFVHHEFDRSTKLAIYKLIHKLFQNENNKNDVIAKIIKAMDKDQESESEMGKPQDGGNSAASDAMPIDLEDEKLFYDVIRELVQMYKTLEGYYE